MISRWLRRRAESRRIRVAGSATCLPVAWGVNLHVGGFDRKPHLAARVEGQLRDRCGRDVGQGGWLTVELEPDPVG
jgi:hypothetical protein